MEQVEANDFYVYGLSDPRDKRIRYIGISQDPEFRLKQHLNRAGNRWLLKWLLELDVVGMQPDLVFLDTTDKANRYAVEKQWIQKLLSEGSSLCNIINGDPRMGIRMRRMSKKEQERLHEFSNRLNNIHLEITGKPFEYLGAWNYSMLTSPAFLPEIELITEAEAEAQLRNDLQLYQRSASSHPDTLREPDADPAP